ncbi:hypothetical protein L2E82_20433 [Cichorium intybus]|uniref:Uncharacterized protein n=1 Tax=Cichorium intybus TaxID=13427 RepID=A0ACB9DU53_CICIN|nr:hypothetical protein L2E82_20433 [Cichorium intybus]
MQVLKSNFGPIYPEVDTRSSFGLWSQARCRINYFILIVFLLGLGFLRRPLAIVPAMLTALTIAFLNGRETKENSMQCLTQV